MAVSFEVARECAALQRASRGSEAKAARDKLTFYFFLICVRKRHNRFYFLHFFLCVRAAYFKHSAEERNYFTMTKSTFHDTELDRFIEEATTANMQGNDLLIIIIIRTIRYKEGVTQENPLRSSNASRKKLRDFLENKGVPCVKGTGDSIQLRLLGITAEGTQSALNINQRGAPSSHTPGP